MGEMSGTIRGIGKHTLVYGAGIVAKKLTSFLMLPIYTRFLTPSDYGVLELLSMTIDLIGTIAGVGLASAVFRFYNSEDDPDAKRQIMSTAAVGVTVLAAVTALLGQFAAAPLSTIVLGADGDPVYFHLFFLIYLVQAAESIPLLYLRAQQRSRFFVTVSVAKLLAMLSLNIYFVVGLRMGVLGVLLSNLIATAVFALGLTIHLLRRIGIDLSPARLKAMAGFGFPLVFVYLGNFVMVYSDRYFIQHFIGTDAVGIYSLAYKFAFILSALAFQPFQMVWAPYRFDVGKRDDARAIYRKVFLYLNLILGFVALGIGLFVRDVLAVMADPAFFAAHRVVPLVLLAQLLSHWTAYCNVSLFLTDNTRLFAGTSAVGAVVVLALNLVMIPRWGVPGAAVATVAAYGARFLSVYSFGQRKYRIDYGWGRIGRLYAILGVAVGARLVLADLPMVASLATSTLLFLIAAGAVYAVVLDADQKRALRGVAAQPASLLSSRA